jgi:hypothetical protein
LQQLLPDVLESIRAGNGGELGSSDFPGKMQAIHSSSALGINIFQYWKSISAVPVIAAACGLCKRGSDVSFDIRFEEKFPIHDGLGFHPNVDVVIHNRPDATIKRFAIECKFSEAYGGYKHSGLKPKYLDYEEPWDGIPNLRGLARLISPEDKDFHHLHPAQLIKHILAMKRRFGLGGFRLLYLWYDVIGEESKRHRDEIAEFSRVAKEDGVKFHSLTYQELIITLANQERSEHREYIQYLKERYF